MGRASAGTWERWATIDDAATEWAELAEAADDVFATAEWLGAWWRHFGRGRELVILGRRDAGGRLIAILPLYVAARRPVRIVRFLGHGPTDRLGPVATAVDGRGALGDLVSSADPGRWDLLLADELAIDDDAWAPRIGGRVLATRTGHVARLEGHDGDSWWATRTANLRSQLGRAERSLRAEGKVSYRETTHADELDRDLASLLDLHARRWAATGGSRSFVGREGFHRDVTRTALAQGRLRLRFLEVDGRPVSALYNLRFCGAESFYQAGRDPAFDRWSVGLLLHAHALRTCADEGLREYRFLRGDEPYKRRLADASVHHQTVCWSRSPAGAVAASTVAAMPRLSKAQQRWVPSPWAWGTGGSPRVGRP